MIARAEAWLRGLSTSEAGLAFLAENLLIFAGALALGHAAMALGGRRPEAERPPRVSRAEILLALTVVLVNSGVTLVGWRLWTSGWIRVRSDAGGAALLDFLVLLLAMDVAMYVLHSLAHHPRLYRRLHEVHHRYERPRPLTLFVMHPLEAAGFGALWLGLLCVYSPTWAGLSAYLAVNVVSGTIGHLGGRAIPSLGPIAGSDFHGAHHRDPSRNLGFYTRIWDRIFGTLAEGTGGPGTS